MDDVSVFQSGAMEAMQESIVFAHAKSVAPKHLPETSGIRGKVTGFSTASRNRLREYLCRLLTAMLAGNSHFVTLTYGADGPPSAYAAKKHLKYFKDWLKRTFDDVWGAHVVEFQDRGVIHFHLLICGYAFTPSEIEQMRQEWLRLSGDNGSSPEDRKKYGFHFAEISSAGGLAPYFSKEISKTKQKAGDWNGLWWGFFGPWKDNLSDVYEEELDPADLDARLADLDVGMRPKPGYVMTANDAASPPEKWLAQAVEGSETTPEEAAAAWAQLMAGVPPRQYVFSPTQYMNEGAEYLLTGNPDALETFNKTSRGGRSNPVKQAKRLKPA